MDVHVCKGGGRRTLFYPPTHLCNVINYINCTSLIPTECLCSFELTYPLA